ncbi:hypothetical protein [Clostridium magnum]|uniref:hypothetical protein n=1 Tax=Clostridium magnum TaxID=33954 RepID=UPI0009225E9B|nr:hypothetical protein [Clostridium magnum]SHJ14599.1 hypothetical protein SAMN02745944_05444 [Clostridium magnum DSM 2767]
MKGIELLKLINKGKIIENCPFYIKNSFKGLVIWDGENIIHYSTKKSLAVNEILIYEFEIKTKSEFEPVEEIKHDNIEKENKQHKTTIKDFIIDEMIKENAYKLQNNLLEIIDRRINQLNNVLCGRNEPFEYDLKDIEQAKKLYLKASEFRKLISKEKIQEFNELEQNEIIKALNIIHKENRYKSFIEFM